jgi:hypothetical protein
VNGSIIENWNGTAWSIVTAPGSTALNGVSAISSTDVWAVGYSVSTRKPIVAEPFTEQWNGTSWTVVTTPQFGSAQLNAIAALPNGDTWAAGAMTTVRSFVSLTDDPNTLVLET